MTPEVEDALASMTAVNNEFFYWMSIALMMLIHAGFLAYEIGASRSKNVLATAMKNLLAFATIVASFFFVGWFLYNAMPSGFLEFSDAAKAALPWSENMGPNTADPASGIFWGAFALFAATTGSIMSGAVLERIRTSGFLILTVFVGSVVWIIGAAWGWHGAGWMLTKLGFHDVGAAGCVHMIAGFAALGILINLGPRIGRFLPDGTPVTIRPHNLPLTLLGLFLIFTGFFGFLMGCVIYGPTGYATIYGSPTTLSAFAFNTLMGLVGGIIGAYVMSRGEPFWTISGGLAGVIAVAAGLDLYHPALTFVIALVGGGLVPYIGKLLDKMRIDDVVGAVAVHGGMGLYSLIAAGIFLAGYPNTDGNPSISFWGQLVGALVFAALGFIPTYLLSLLLKSAGLLRIPPEVEEQGLDLTEIPATPYPEGIPVTAMRSTSGTAVLSVGEEVK
ncbi:MULTISPECIES: ammonium transporter [Mycobacteriaceae]|uniref:Ammonium transporter n=1 Tax=Mycolicibacterium parafortuitum TaxID=39692 RepID=A0ACC6MG98_MYCPF|nr:MULTISPECIES: ammonium transporter [Mycobacteriaceae]MBX7453604.1 ammonium transporter [Mycolicibacterium aurantiacum]MDZ5085999.1 ammonium transporter [Mycolicibacterium parafortuitum]GFM19042.1 Rh family protein/ammonium transporter [Mycobacterium sp. PO1]GFM25583.1 Rh family protein/ammonium transporter [Mycobacterium sp. PO2]